MLEFRIVNVKFPPDAGGLQRIEKRIVFPSRVRTAEACLRSFYAIFTNADKHFHQLSIWLNDGGVFIDGSEVVFTVYYGLRDFSGTWDDKFEGEMEVLVIADIVDDRVDEFEWPVSIRF